MSAWAVAEIVIACLPKHRRHQTSSSAPATTIATSKADTSPLLGAPLPQASMSDDDNNNDDDDDQSSANFNDNNGTNENKYPVSVVNFMGCSVAGLTVVGTGPILFAIASNIFQSMFNSGAAGGSNTTTVE